MTLSVQAIQSITTEVYADMDKLHDEFDSIQAAHPEIWEDNMVCSAFEYFMEKLNAASFSSPVNAITGINEATKAHRILNGAAVAAFFLGGGGA